MGRLPKCYELEITYPLHSINFNPYNINAQSHFLGGLITQHLAFTVVTSTAAHPHLGGNPKDGQSSQCECHILQFSANGSGGGCSGQHPSFGQTITRLPISLPANRDVQRSAQSTTLMKHSHHAWLVKGSWDLGQSLVSVEWRM